MKQELTTQEDWLVEHNIAVQEPNRELCLTLPLFKEQEPRVDLSCNAITRQRLQQQLGKPDSVNNSLDSAHGSGDHARSGDQEKIAEHFSSAMALAESLIDRKNKNLHRRKGTAGKLSYGQRKTTGVLICRHLVAALRLEVAQSEGAQH